VEEGLTHLTASGHIRMVDVSDKAVTRRIARVRGEIRLQASTVHLITQNKVAKGNVLETARLAGIMAAKRTADLIPLCHPLNITDVDIEFDVGEDRIQATAVASVEGRTGVEMEAMMAVSVALLTIYDMCKAVDRGMIISQIRLEEKRGGRSGTYVRDSGSSLEGDRP
jgi:cyclic pyranopterin phosphate synthase